MNPQSIIYLVKLMIETGVLSSDAPTDVTPVTPPTSGAGYRPNCGLGNQAKLVKPDDTGKNDYWICVPSFK